MINDNVLLSVIGILTAFWIVAFLDYMIKKRYIPDYELFEWCIILIVGIMMGGYIG